MRDENGTKNRRVAQTAHVFCSKCALVFAYVERYTFYKEKYSFIKIPPIAAPKNGRGFLRPKTEGTVSKTRFC
jgi:hypothetical protein